MIDSSAISTGYSADVRLWLTAGGTRIPLAQVGPDYIVLRTPATLDPCEGEVVMEVDGEAQSWPVRVTEHVTPIDRCIRVRPRRR